MPGSPADDHDRDKLGRWHRDLALPPGPPSIADGEGMSRLVGTRVKPRFPIYAVFLVSANDRAAHDIFRQFRASLESPGAGFEHLRALTEIGHP